MLKAYKYRLYPNKEQEQKIAQHFGCVRYVYNWGLERKIKEYQKTKKSPSCFDLCNELIELKSKNEWLKEVNSQSLQMALRNLDNGFTSFFKKHNAFPKFKNRYTKQSYQCPQRVEIRNGKIFIPNLKEIKIKLHRNFEGKIKTTTISRSTTNKYYASILVDDGKDLPNKKQIKNAIGVDVGLTTFATISTGEKIANPKFLDQSLERLRALQRRLSKKEKDSQNRLKAKHKIALLHEKITNQRKDFLHKLSKRFIDENQAIALEDLNIKGMVKNHNLARHISDSSWGEFVRMLEYKAEWYGSTVVKIGRFQPSSKICSCGWIKQDLTLKDRKWTCGVCGLTHDRDVLASQNILKFSGLEQPDEPVEMLSSDKSVKQETACL